MTARLAKMNAKLNARHERMIAKIGAWIEGTEALMGKLETNPGNSAAVAEHREVPKAAVKNVGALKKQHGEQHLAAGRRQYPKKRTSGNGGY
jgi:hypothetical protein